MRNFREVNSFKGFYKFSEYYQSDKIYAQAFGFTEKEVDHLLKNSLPSTHDEDDPQIKLVKSWYCYNNMPGLTMYNPYSIMNWLENKALD